jgi:1-pyrroline-5-carboxylate dehydrogenase
LARVQETTCSGDAEFQKLNIGRAEGAENFIGPVIHERSCTKLDKVITVVKNDKTLTLLAVGKTDSSNGWFVYPTIYRASDPKHSLIKTELFGPILTVYVYRDSEFSKMPDLIDSNTGYALTGVFLPMIERRFALQKIACMTA